MIIAITGHRPHKLNNEYDGVGPLSRAIRLYLQAKIDELRPDKLITGMALGVDQIWAEIAIANNIPFIAAIPCTGQSARWPVTSYERYCKILANPLCTMYLVHDGPYNNTCMQQRNAWMVNNCDLLIAVWDGSAGGTANCVNYADSMHKPIVSINPRSLVVAS